MTQFTSKLDIDIAMYNSFRRHLHAELIGDLIKQENIKFEKLINSKHKTEKEKNVLDQIFVRIFESMYHTIDEHKILTKSIEVEAFTHECIDNHFVLHPYTQPLITKTFFDDSFLTKLQLYNPQLKSAIHTKKIYDLLPYAKIVEGHVPTNAVSYFEEDEAKQVLNANYVILADGNDESLIQPITLVSQTIRQENIFVKIEELHQKYNISKTEGKLGFEDFKTLLLHQANSNYSTYLKAFDSIFGRKFLKYPNGLSDEKARQIIRLVRNNKLPLSYFK
ncbi:MAG: hypothetical protein ACP5N2_00595 [Candidatus Nanoarchaeia archaeon]